MPPIGDPQEPFAVLITLPSRYRSISATLAIIVCASAAGQENPVYVDDSPLAREMLRRAADQVQDNAGEAARIYQELLDEFAAKVVAAPSSRIDAKAEGGPAAGDDQFVDVRGRVLQALLARPALLERYQLIQEAEAKRQLQDGQLQRLAESRSLTVSGLEAMLRLAQGDLETGRFYSCIRWAREAAAHPAIDPWRSAHCWHMIGLAAHQVGDLDLQRQAIEALSAPLNRGELRDGAPGAPAPSADARIKLLADDLAKLALAPALPRTSRGASTLDCPQAVELEQLIAEPIWSAALESSRSGDPSRGDTPESNEMMGRPSAPRDRLAGDFLTAAPTVAGDSVFVNEGHRIRAFDRYTQRLLWTYPPGQAPGRTDSDVQEVGDMNIVVVNSGALVTFTGHAEGARRSGSGEVVCLDADTGQLRWSLRLDRLGSGLSSRPPGGMGGPSPEEFAELFPHGAPVIAEGRVFLQARKVTKQLLASTYVICLDLDDGHLLWARHIASCGGIRTNPARSFSSVVLDRGDLFVATSIGAIASLDAATGLTHWLHKFTAPLNPTGFDMRPWEIDAPLVTSIGVIAIQPDQRRIVVLDRATGDRLASYPALESRTWGDPQYLLANSQRVFAVGRSSIRAFDLNDLAKPVWIVRDTDPQTDENDASDRLQIRGRVQLVCRDPGATGDPGNPGARSVVDHEPGHASHPGDARSGMLIVPTTEGFLIFDERTGQIVHQLATKSFGNPLAIDNQLIVATDDSLDVYMPFARAERMLRQRLVAAPQDAEPALALMRLAMRARDARMSLEAAGLAWRAIAALPDHLEGRLGGPAAARPDGTDPRHEELFQMLLAMNGQRLAATIEDGESLHAMIGQVAVTPAQRLERQLAYGEWLAANDRLAEAVESYQAILSDRQIGSTKRAGLESRRSGYDWAREQLTELIRLHGPRAYGPQSDFAARRLAQITAAPPVKGEALQALAEEFPLAPAAVDASLLAARTFAAAGEPRRALAVLTAMSRFELDRTSADRVYAALVELCLEPATGELVDQARAVLTHVIQTSGNLTLQSAAGPIPAAAWLERLPGPGGPGGSAPGAGAGRAGKPRLGEIHGDAMTLAGLMLRPVPGIAVANLPDRIPLIEKTTVRLVTTPQLTEQWSVDLGMTGLLLARNTDRDMLLWSPSPAEEARAVMLDAVHGSQRWVSQRVGNLLPMPLGVRDAAAQMPNGEVFVPAETMPLVSRHDLVLVRRTGGVVALSLADGATVRWKRQRTLDQVHLAQLHDYGLVLAGMRWRGEGVSDRVLEPAILVIDPVTGTTLFETSGAPGIPGAPGVPGAPGAPGVPGAASAPVVPVATGAPGDAADVDAMAGPARWMTITDMGQLIVGTAKTIESIDLLSGQTLWVNVSSAAADTLEGWALSDRVVVEDSRSDLVDLRALRLSDGQATNSFEPPIRSGWGPRELRDLEIEGDRIYAHYSDRIVRFDPQGGQHGADVVTDERDYRWLIPAADRLIVISRLMARQVPNMNIGPHRTVHAYRIYALAEDCRLLGDTLQEIDQPVGQVGALDGWLLLSLESREQVTQAIPMPADR